MILGGSKFSIGSEANFISESDKSVDIAVLFMGMYIMSESSSLTNQFPNRESRLIVAETLPATTEGGAAIANGSVA